MIAISVAVILAILLVAYMFPLALVQGNSMLPNLKHGQVLLTRRVLSNRAKEGNIYVYKSPVDSDRLVIKRLRQKYHYSEDCYFLGDNPTESYDSRDYGYVNAENIIAVLIWNTKYQLKSKGDN